MEAVFVLDVDGKARAGVVSEACCDLTTEKHSPVLLLANCISEHEVMHLAWSCRFGEEDFVAIRKLASAASSDSTIERACDYTKRWRGYGNNNIPMQQL
jgi:hypothetical protein